MPQVDTPWVGLAALVAMFVIPFLPDWLQWIYFLIKVFLILFFYVWMRWTLPRYRYDQLMEFGWKWLLPISVVNLLATAVLVLWIG